MMFQSFVCSGVSRDGIEFFRPFKFEHSKFLLAQCLPHIFQIFPIESARNRFSARWSLSMNFALLIWAADNRWNFIVWFLSLPNNAQNELRVASKYFFFVFLKLSILFLLFHSSAALCPDLWSLFYIFRSNSNGLHFSIIFEWLEWVSVFEQ